MGNKLYLAAAIIFLCEACFAQAPTPEVSTAPATSANPALQLIDGTPIRLRTNQDISSADAKVGDRVLFRVVEDVKAGDLIVIHRGAEAWGLVSAVQLKGRKGHGGRLDVEVKSVHLLSGEDAALRADERVRGKNVSMGREMLEMEGQSGILLAPFLPLVMLEKGKDAYLPANTKVVAYVNGNIELERTKLESVQPAPVHRTGPATITIFRAGDMLVYSPSVYCGKIALARLSHDHYLRIQLPPGKYSFSSNDKQIVELQLEDGQEIYLQVQMVTHRLTAQGHMERVGNEEGEDEIARLHQLGDKDLTKVSDANLADLQAVPDVK